MVLEKRNQVIEEMNEEQKRQAKQQSRR